MKTKIKGIYKISSKIDGRFYIGRSLDCASRLRRHLNELKGSRHVNQFLQRTFDKYGEDNLEFEVIEEHDDTATESFLVAREQWYFDHSDRSKMFNMVFHAEYGGDLISSHPNKEEIIKKIAEGGRKNFTDPDFIKRTSLRVRGKGNPMYGKNHTEESKRKMSAGVRKAWVEGRYKPYERTDETKLKLSEWAKSRTGDKNPFYGKTHSQETKDKLSAIMKERMKDESNLPSNTRKVEINGVVYASMARAAKAVGCTSSTIRNRINNPNFPDYRFV